MVSQSRRHRSWFIGVFFVFSILFLSNQSLMAYQDLIASSPDEIWTAVQQVFEPHGVRTSKREQGEIESRWIKDRVVRQRRLLFIKKSFKKNVERRYRVHVKLNGMPRGTEVVVKGKFQERPGTAHPQTRWQWVKPDIDDYGVEREFFYKILRQIEKNRRAAAHPKPPTQIS